MSPYYDQPGWRQRGPEDVAGVLVLFACAAVGFCWYVAVSRLHLRNVQCLEIFLYGAILFFGGGLIIAQLVGRRKKREENWPHPAIVIPASKDARDGPRCQPEPELRCSDTTSTRSHGCGRIRCG